MDTLSAQNLPLHCKQLLGYKGDRAWEDYFDWGYLPFNDCDFF